MIELDNHSPTSKSDWLSKMRFGRPHPCKAGTTEEMTEMGFVGLYLKHDQILHDWEKEVATPENLKEPQA